MFFRAAIPALIYKQCNRRDIDTGYNYGYTHSTMKTAISIPDSIFQAAEGLAHRLKKSRSELYAEAVAEYMKVHKNQDVTSILNEIYANESSGLDEELYAMQSRSIAKEQW